jgi:hypothetical protein
LGFDITERINDVGLLGVCLHGTDVSFVPSRNRALKVKLISIKLLKQIRLLFTNVKLFCLDIFHQGCSLHVTQDVPVHAQESFLNIQLVDTPEIIPVSSFLVFEFGDSFFL